MAQIGDLVTGPGSVQDKLAGRVDILTKAPGWIMATIRELSDNYEFTELEAFGLPFQLTAGTQGISDAAIVSRYDIKNFINENDQLRDMVFFEIFTDWPTNSFTSMLKYRESAVVLPVSRVFSLPRWWTRHGNTIIFGPGPVSPFTVTGYYQRKHPFDTNSLATLNNSLILMPDSWLEIISYGAAMRGAAELRLPDFVVLFKQMLFGDPKKPGELGLLQSRVSQHQKDKGHNEGQMVPRVERYT